MGRKFDIELYHQYVNDMVALMDDLSDPRIFENIVQKTLPIMNLFGIALLTSEYAETSRAPGLNSKEFSLPPELQLGEANMECEVAIAPMVSDVVKVRLLAYPRLDNEAWDTEMKAEVKGFLGLYFNLVARVRMLRMFESRIFSDQTMPFVGNLTAMMRSLRSIKGAGQLSNYTAYRMNISKFSRYNTVFGRQVGDRLLHTYIMKLKEFSVAHGGVYRLGGDNFLGLIPNEMTPAVHKFFEGYNLKLDDTIPEVTIRCKAGFYQISDNSNTPDLVLKRTNSTYTKANGKNRICYFSEEEEKLEEMEVQIENEFIQAMADGEVVAFYQPKVNVETGKIIGVEALCRWKHNGTIIPPFKFIPILERDNQICNLDFYMLSKVCEDLINWISKGNEAVRVSVNFSRNNLADKNMVKKILDTIDRYNVPHDLITIELTETTMEVDYDSLVSIVNDLKANNVQIAVDDFGMGYSSLNLLRNIDWDVLKIDKAFVPENGNSTYDKQLIMLRNVIRLANDIGMVSVVEGVETEEQLEMVKNCGCKVIQGYYFDKPLAREEFESKLLGTFDGECKWKA